MARWFPDFSQRSPEPEIMDGDDYTPAEAHGAYRDLRKVNRYLGGTAALMRHLKPLLVACRSRPIRILDVGTGSADIPQAIARMARQIDLMIDIVAVDLNPQALAAARDATRVFPEIHLVQAHALELPFVENAFDFVISSELLHHLNLKEAAMFLRHLHGKARVAFLINDLRRHPIPYYSFWVLSRLFTINRLIRNDGLVSIRRGFTREDLRELQQGSQLTNLSVHFHFPYRLVIMGRKSDIS